MPTWTPIGAPRTCALPRPVDASAWYPCSRRRRCCGSMARVSLREMSKKAGSNSSAACTTPANCARPAAAATSDCDQPRAQTTSWTRERPHAARRSPPRPRACPRGAERLTHSMAPRGGAALPMLARAPALPGTIAADGAAVRRSVGGPLALSAHSGDVATASTRAARDGRARRCARRGGGSDRAPAVKEALELAQRRMVEDERQRQPAPPVVDAIGEAALELHHPKRVEAHVHERRVARHLAAEKVSGDRLHLTRCALRRVEHWRHTAADGRRWHRPTRAADERRRLSGGRSPACGAWTAAR